MSEQRILAVMYHYVRNRAGSPEAGIHGLGAGAFGRQLDQLSALAEPITWPMLNAWHRGRGSLPGRCFLLTFDDGLADHVEVVAPILEARGLRGVFFVPARVLETGRMESAHQIHLLQAKLGDQAFLAAVTEWLIRHHPQGDRLDEVDQAAARRVYHYESAERAAVKYLLAFTLPSQVREEMIAVLFARRVGDPGEYARRWYLDAGDLTALVRAGHTIGGHGFAHEPYLRLSAPEQVRDLSRCASVLRQILGPGTRPFSYAYGSFDDAVAWRCHQAGFAQAFTTRPGWIRRFDNVHALNRLDTKDADAFCELELSCPLR